MTPSVETTDGYGKPSYSWKLVLLLWLMGTAAAIGLVPYVLELYLPSTGSVPGATRSQVQTTLIVATVAQYSIYSLLSAILGQWLARQIDLGAPILRSLVDGRFLVQRLRAILPLSVILGLIGGVIIVALDVFVFSPLLRAELGQPFLQSLSNQPKPSAWAGLLASFEGGIVEELMLRYFLMSLFVWLGSLLIHTADGRPTAVVLWIANIVAAMLFGAGHLPAAATAGLPLTMVMIVRILALNSLLGIVFGYLYWKRGLEAAMISHFSADFVFHFMTALLP